MEKLEAEVASLRSRAETLSSRHAAADAEFCDAKSKLQRHHLEADLNADDKARTKLEIAVATCAVTRDGYADALAEVQTKITDAGAAQSFPGLRFLGDLSCIGRAEARGRERHRRTQGGERNAGA
jgi:hypothetical protein